MNYSTTHINELVPDPATTLEVDLRTAVYTDLLNMTLTESCRVLAVETCKNEAINQAKVLNPECFRVLDIGPGIEDVAEGCEDIRAANILFGGEVVNICDAAEVNAPLEDNSSNNSTGG